MKGPSKLPRKERWSAERWSAKVSIKVKCRKVKCWGRVQSRQAKDNGPTHALGACGGPERIFISIQYHRYITVPRNRSAGRAPISWQGWDGRSRTPPRLSPAARRRYRRDLRQQGRDILELVKGGSASYTRNELLSVGIWRNQPLTDGSPPPPKKKEKKGPKNK